MAVETLTAFPTSLVSGNTLRVSLSDGDYPSDSWTLKVVFRGETSRTFTADSVANNAYELVIPASETAKLTPGSYTVTLLYTETDGGERASSAPFKVQVLPDPTKEAPPTLARKTLNAMENALLAISQGTLTSANFNGQSFTKKNLKELQDAIDRQRAVVEREESGSDIESGMKRHGGLGVRFASGGSGWPWGSQRGDFW